MSRAAGGVTGVGIVLTLFALGVGCGSSSVRSSAAGAAGYSASAGSGTGGTTGDTAGTQGGGAAGMSGGSAATAGSAAAGASNDEMAACKAYAAAYCSLVFSCEISTFHDFYGTMDNCTGGRIVACMDRFAASGAQTTPAAVSACAAVLIPANGCSILRPECTFQGTLVGGMACAYDAQCQSKLCKTPTYGGVCGTCAEPATAGGVCHQANGCASGLQCVKGVCVRSLPLGSACDPTQLDCAFLNVCTAGTCQPGPGINQPCDEQFGGCSRSDDIECLKGVCQKLVWSTVGGDCDANNGILCLGGLSCNPIGGPGKCELSTAPLPVLAAGCK